MNDAATNAVDHDQIRALFENAAIGLYRSTPDGRILLANPALVRMLGFSSAADLAERNLEHAGFPDGRTRAEFKRRIEQDGRVEGLESAWVRQDGSVMFARESAVLVRDEAGQPLYYDGSVEDVTERKQAEAAQRKASADIERADAMAHLGNWEWRVSDNRLTWSKEIYRIFGLPQSTVLTFDGILSAVHSEDRAACQRFADRLLSGETAGELDFRVVRPNGEVRRVHQRAEVYRDHEGSPLTIFGTMQDVTDMREIEGALRRSEKKYRELIDNLNDIVFTVDIEGIVHFVSPAIRSVLGYAAAEVVGQHYEQYVHPEDLPAVRASFEDTLAGDLQPTELRMRTAAGEYRWVRTSCRPALADGVVVGISGVLTDIAERRRAEEVARASEAKATAALRLAHLGYWEYDVERDLFTFNDHLYDLLRTTAAREGGYTMSSRRYAERFIPPEEAGVVATETLEALEATDPNYTSQLEHRVVFGDGTTGYLAVRIFIAKDSRGRTTRTYGVNQDITERRQAEEALRASEERLRGVFQAAVDGIVVADADTGAFVMVNQTMCDMLGYSEEELLRLGVEDLHPREALATVRDAWRKQVAGLEPLATDMPVMRRNGTTFIADINAVPFTMAGRSCLLGVFRDVTAFKELQAQMRQAQKMEAVGRLAGGVAHDFNNILGVILGQSELSQKSLRRDDPLRKSLEQIQASAERAAALTRQLLVFSRKQEVQPVVLDLNAIVRNLGSMLRRLIGEDVELELRLDDAAALVRADLGQVEQVVINLAVNARDAMPSGGRLVIATGEADPGSSILDVEDASRPAVVLTVTDTGCGMDETTKQHLFEPFFTTKEVGKGTGLGLSTVYGIVQQAGGSVDVESELGRGTVFRVLLPRVEGESPSEPAAVGRPADKGHGDTVLVVEDEAGLRAIVRDTIAELGYKPVVAANGGEALLAVEEQHLRPDVLITDVVMPGMNGTTLAGRLCRTLPDLKILFMSGYTDVAERAGTIGRSPQRLLRKPFRTEELARAIRETLDESESARGAGSM